MSLNCYYLSCPLLYLTITYLIYYFYFNRSETIPRTTRKAKFHLKFLDKSLEVEILREPDCLKDQKLVVVVTCQPKDRQIRKAIRDTWASERDNDIQVVFLFGRTNDSSWKLTEEFHHFRDMILTDIQEGYRSLPWKTYIMLKWINDRCETPPDCVMKVDSDVVAFPRNLRNLCRKFSASDPGTTCYFPV